MQPLFFLYFLISRIQSLGLSDTEMLKSRACYKIIDGFLEKNNQFLPEIYKKHAENLGSEEVLLGIKHDLYKLCMKNLSKEKSQKILRDFQFFDWSTYSDLLKEFEFSTYLSDSPMSITQEIKDLNQLILEEEKKYKELEEIFGVQSKKIRRPSVRPKSGTDL